MIAVVTGSNGFIGSHLVDLLVREGISVRRLHRKPPPPDQPPEPAIEDFVIDFNQPDSIHQSGALEGATHCFHLAGVTKSVDYSGFRRGNVQPLQALLAAAQKMKVPLQRLVLVSSLAAGGPAYALNAPRTESMPSEAMEPYGKSKWEAEQVLHNQHIPFTIVRPSSVYGPRDVDFLNIFKQVSAGIGLYAANKHKYTATIHVSDLVEGILQAGRHTASLNETYYLCHEEAVTWQAIYKETASLMGKRMREVNIPFLLLRIAGRAGDLFSHLSGKTTLLNSNKIALSQPHYWTCSSKKAKQELGFAPRIPLAKGLRQTYHWYQEQGWL